MINIGTVMEIYNNEVLIMTADFDLIRVKRKPEMFLGQQVGFRNSDIIRPGLKKIQFILSAAAAVMVIALIAFYIIPKSGIITGDNLYAFVDMDINPSIEFLIDDSNTVQKVLPLNDDAENLIKTLKLKNLVVTEAVEKVISRSQETGILNSDKKDIIMISVSLNPESTEYKDRRDKAELKLNQLLNSIKVIDDGVLNKEYTINAIKVEPEIKKHALKNSISSGRQLIFEKAQNNGIDLTLDEAKTGNLLTLMESAGMDEENTDKGFLSTPPLNSPKTTNELDRASEDEIANMSTPTPVPISTGIVSSYENTPNAVKDLVPTGTRTPQAYINIGPTVSKTPSTGPENSKAPDSSAGSIKVQYYNASKEAGEVIQINAVFKVINTGDEAIDLSDMSLRYYYTVDGEKLQELGCWAEEDKSNITYRFVKMNNPVEKADYYLEIGFKNGRLEPGKSTAVVVWFNKVDWSIYKQDDDYSYNSPSMQELYDWKYVTGYISGVMKWGVEP